MHGSASGEDGLYDEAVEKVTGAMALSFGSQVYRPEGVTQSDSRGNPYVGSSARAGVDTLAQGGLNGAWKIGGARSIPEEIGANPFKV